MIKVKKTVLCMLMISAGFFLSPVQAGYTETKHPVVLIHGLLGFDSVGGLVDYFHTVSWNLERSGAKVYTAQVSALGHSEDRGVQLKNYIVQNITEPKVNIFGHSQGAPTARVAASLIPERIASITSISGANKGSAVADVVRGVIPPDSSIEGGAEAVANALGSLISLLSNDDNPQSSIDALDSLTTAGAAAVNSRHGWGINTETACGRGSENVNVYGNNIKMFSWVGVRTFTNILDSTDYFLGITGLAFGGQPNDGLVNHCSQYMGRVVYDNQIMNHLDSVNHLFGIDSIWFSPISLYRSHTNRLKNLGL